MNPERKEVQIFNAALELPTPAERAAFLDRDCAGDEPLRRKVEALLQACGEADDFFQTVVAPPRPAGEQGAPARPAGPTGTALLPITEKAGDKIGRYKLRERLGEGGCGVVYVAEQEEPVRRRVALKVIKLGMDTKSVVARFEAERQALAMMDHPNIAKVLDAGATDTGRPYFVMELVRGIRITDYCDQNNLSTRERLDLFIKVCQAVQHAHQKGIIHRDLKPSNILVTLHDGVPVPKVIDFGIAKATEGRLTDATVYTELHQFIGTPAYMSPEQAEMSGLDIDTRSDIYSLGVLLYELLTGKTPFDAKELWDAGLDAMRRTIREQEPVRPSTRLQTMIAGELTTTAKHRQAEPPKLINLLRGDLDWVVMKALEKDRTRRYETANGFAQDVQRHLSNEAVTARPPSLLYKFQKTVSRNKPAFAAAAAVFIALLTGLGLTAWQAVRAKNAELGARRAEQAERAQSEQARADRDRAVLAEDQAKQRTAEANQNLAKLNVSEGWRQVESGDTFGALASFADAFLLEEADPSRAEIHRLRLASTFKDCPKLVNVWSVGDSVQMAKFSPDGGRVATASPTQEVFRIWEAATGIPTATAILSTNANRTITISPEGRVEPYRWADSVVWTDGGTRIFTASSSAEKVQMRFWDAATGHPVGRTIEVTNINRCGHGVRYSHGRIAFLRYGCLWSDASTNGMPPIRESFSEKLTVFDSRDGRTLWERTGRPNQAGFIRTQFSPDGAHLIGHNQVLDAATGNTRLAFPFSDEYTRFAFSEDGNMLFAKGMTNGHALDLNLFSARENYRLLAKLPPTIGDVSHSEFSRSGRLLALATSDRAVWIWDCRQMAFAAPPSLLRSSIEQIDFSPDDTLFATVGSDNCARVWDAATGLPVSPLIPHRAQILDTTFSSNGEQLLTVTSDGLVRVWDLRGSGTARFVWRSYHSVEGVTISPDGMMFSGIPGAGDYGGYAGLWSLRTGDLTLWPLDEEMRSRLTFTPDSGRVGTRSAGHWITPIKQWDTSSGKLLTPKFRLGRSATEIHTFSRDGQFLLVKDTNLVVLESMTGRTVARHSSPSTNVLLAALTPDGKYVCARQRDGATMFWDWSNSIVVVQPKQPTAWTGSFDPDIQRSPDGRWIFWGKDIIDPLAGIADRYGRILEFDGNFWKENGAIRSDGQKAVVWKGDVAVLCDPTNGRPVAPACAHQSSVKYAAFAPRNHLLVTTSEDRTARLWDSDTGDAVTPPMRHELGVNDASFAPDGKFIITSGSRDYRLWELPEDTRSAVEWRELASYFARSEQAAKGSNAPTAGAVRQQWIALRQKSPASFTVSDAEIDGWQRHQAWRAEESEDWPNALRHLDRLVTQHPDSPDLLLRRATVHMALAKDLPAYAITNHLQAVLADCERIFGWLARKPEVAKLGRQIVQSARREALVKLGRWAEAQEAQRETLDIAPRPSQTGTNLIDLSRWYNWNTDEFRPDSLRTLAGVEFDVRASICLKSTDNEGAEDNPEAVTGIKVGMRCQKVHFLHTTFTTNETVGLLVGKFVIHLAGGQSYTREIKLGDDVWDFTVPEKGAKPVTNSRLAWTGLEDLEDPSSDRGQVFLTTWTNPHPDIAVASIDFVSAVNDPTPCLYAITIEP